MPRPAANPFQVGEPARAELNTEHTKTLDYAEEVAGNTYNVQNPTATKLQAAIDAAGTAGGGRVLFSKSFETSVKITLKDNVLLDGGGATIRQASGANLPALMVSDGWESLVGTGTTAARYRHRLFNFTIDGNYEQNLTGATLGLGIYSFGTDLHHIRIHHCRRLGLHTEAGPPVDPTKTPLFDREAATEGFIDAVRINDCIDGGYYFNGPNDPIIDRVFGVRNGYGADPAFPTGDPIPEPGTGFNVKFGPNAVAPVCSRWHLWGNTVWHLYMGDTQGGEFTACQIEGGGSQAGTGGNVYYDVPGATFNGGRIFTGVPAAGWIDNPVGIKFGSNGTNLKIDGTVFHNLRPCFDFNSGSGVFSHIRALYVSPFGKMIAPDGGGTDAIWDIDDVSYDAGEMNIPMGAKRVFYGYTGPKGGGRIVQSGSHSITASNIETTTELTGAAPVVTVGTPTLKTMPLGSRMRFTHRGTGTATFVGDTGGAQIFGHDEIVSGQHSPALDGTIVLDKNTAIAGSISTTKASVSVVTSGTQQARMAAYSDSSGTPDARLGFSDTRNIVAADVGGLFGIAYVSFTWSTPLVVTNGQIIWLALHLGATAEVVRPSYTFTSGLTGSAWMATGQTFASGAPADLTGIGTDQQGHFYMQAQVPAPVTVQKRSGTTGLAQWATAELYRAAFAEYVLAGELS